MMNPAGLAITTPSDREIEMTRVFRAPRRLVFDAHTKPELVKRWLGVFGGWTLDICEIDLRVGGRFRYLWRGPEGAEMGMGGVYREVNPPDRLVTTEVFEQAWHPGEAISTLVLLESNGLTKLTNTILYESKEIRDGVLKSPMEKGVSASYDQLAGLLADSEHAA